MKPLLLLSAAMMLTASAAVAATDGMSPDSVYVVPDAASIPKAMAPVQHHNKTPGATMPVVPHPIVQHPAVPPPSAQAPIAVPTMPAQAVVPSPTPVGVVSHADAEPAQKGVKNLWGLLGKGEKTAENPVHPPPSGMKPVSRPTQAVDPEQVLRGKVWTTESACKKEALKGSCSSIDCATHTGGVCSGFTSMIWIYR
jgi:hypothetical protein